MNKHTEAIQALQPFAALLSDIEDLAKSCSVSSQEEATFLIPFKLSDLIEASRVTKEWEDKQANPKIKTRIRCKTCGVLNYYQNLIEDRCPTCDDEMRIYLSFGEVEVVKEKKTRGKKKGNGKTKERSIYEKIVKEMRAMGADELEGFLRSVPKKDSIFYRELLRKY